MGFEWLKLARLKELLSLPPALWFWNFMECEYRPDFIIVEGRWITIREVTSFDSQKFPLYRKVADKRLDSFRQMLGKNNYRIEVTEMVRPLKFEEFEDKDAFATVIGKRHCEGDSFEGIAHFLNTARNPIP